MLALRLVHIVGGVFWVGAGLYNVLFVSKVLTGPEGGRYFARLAATGSSAFGMAATLTVLSGLLLYARDSAGFRLEWITTGTGLAFGLGGLAGITSLVLGATVFGPTAARMRTAQPAEAQALAARLARLARVDVAILTFAAVMMAVARYL